jgi:uncharacterized Tic20 family protein
MSKRINFRVRGFVALIVSFLILIFGTTLYFSLDAGTNFIGVVIGLFIPFFFIGCLLLRAHYRAKKGQSPFGDNFPTYDGAEKI